MEAKVTDETKALIEKLPEMMSQQFIIAKAYKARFDAFVEVGFTEHQALELLKTKGLLV